MTDARDWEALFDTEAGNEHPGWMSGVLCQRAATTRAGDMLYIASYPIWNTQTGRRAAGITPTKAAQKRVNDRRAKLRLEMLINHNFGEGDLLITCTYRDEEQPRNPEEAHRDIRNYVARIRRLRQRKGLSEIKYIYVTETTQSKRRGVRYHHHLIMNSEGLSREEAEKAWQQQARSRGIVGICNSRRAQPTEEGLSGWAHYITKQSGKADEENGKGIGTRRRWCRSRNLKIPETRVSDKRISRRRVERIVLDIEAQAKLVFEQIYPGYELVDCKVRESSYVPGAYIRARMTRKTRRTINPVLGKTMGRGKKNPLPG